jgi:hypothetical protein
VGLVVDILSTELVGGTLSGEFVGGWLWRNGWTDSMLEVELDWLDKIMLGKVKDKMESIADNGGSTTWCR